MTTIFLKIMGRQKQKITRNKHIQIRLEETIKNDYFNICKKNKIKFSKHIRDFRGAMMGRADKGLFITTSSYTQEAKREAERDGAFAIDLINGDLLAEKMKELRLGVVVKNEEIVSFDSEWFKTIDF